MIHDIEGQPRSQQEMRFALSLLPCPDCGTHGTARAEMRGDLTHRPVFAWACPGCGAERAYRFRIWPVLPYHDPSPPGHLGPGDEPSRVIGPDALEAEAGRLAPLVPAEPEELDPDAWSAARALLWRWRTCLIELSKFDGRDRTADRERAEAVLARYQADAPRNFARHRVMYPPKPERGGRSTGSSPTPTARGSGAAAPGRAGSTSPTSTRETSTSGRRTCGCPGSTG